MAANSMRLFVVAFSPRTARAHCPRTGVQHPSRPGRVATAGAIGECFNFLQGVGSKGSDCARLSSLGTGTPSCDFAKGIEINRGRWFTREVLSRYCDTRFLACMTRTAPEGELRLTNH